MRISLTLLVLLLATCAGLAQPQNGQVIRTPLTTNNMMNAPQDGWISIWNNVAKRWSNGVNTASATNDAQPPSTTLTNLSATGAITNLNDNQFAGESTIAAISSGAQLSNIVFRAAQGASRALMVNTNVLVVTNGNVGVGTDAPDAKLRVVGEFIVSGGDITAHTSGSFRDDAFVGDFVLVTDVGPNAAITESSITSQQLQDLAAGGTAANKIANLNGLGTNTTFLNITNSGILTNVGNIWSFGNIIADGGLFANNPSTVSALNVQGIFSATAALNEFQQDLTVGGPLTLNNGQLVFGNITTASTIKTATNSLGGLAFVDFNDTPQVEFLGTDLHFYNEMFFTKPFWPNFDTPTLVPVIHGVNISWATNIWEIKQTSGSDNEGADLAVNTRGGLIVGSLIDADAGAGDIAITNNFYVGGRIIADKWAAIIWGSGSPESVTTALIGSLFLCTNGCTGSGMYVKTNGTGSTGWWLVEGGAGGAGGGGPGTLPMNANQFDTNNPVTIKNGALVTNLNVRTALTLPTLTASRAAVINSSGQLTNSPNVTDTELEFLDGVTSAIQTQLSNDVRVAAGTGGITVTASGAGGIMTYTVNDDDAGGGGSTNVPVQAVGTLILTNGTIYKPLDLGDNTNIVVSWNTNYYVASPSNIFTVSWTDVPASTDGRQIFLKLINTNATAGFFPTNNLNSGSVILLPPLSTNEYTFNYDTNGFWIRSGQTLTTGSGDTNVYNINPVLHGATNFSKLLVTTPFTEYTSHGGSPTTNILIDAGLGNHFRVLLTNTMGLKITNGYDGQRLEVWPYQDGVGNRGLALVPNTGGDFTNNFEYGEDATAPLVLTTNQYKKDVMLFIYEVQSLSTNTSRSNWVYHGVLRKYPN